MSEDEPEGHGRQKYFAGWQLTVALGTCHLWYSRIPADCVSKCKQKDDKSLNKCIVNASSCQAAITCALNSMNNASNNTTGTNNSSGTNNTTGTNNTSGGATNNTTGGTSN